MIFKKLFQACVILRRTHAVQSHGRLRTAPVISRRRISTAIKEIPRFDLPRAVQRGRNDTVQIIFLIFILRPACFLRGGFSQRLSREGRSVDSVLDTAVEGVLLWLQSRRIYLYGGSK